MNLDFMTREGFDALIFIVIFVGVILAAFRLRVDFTRPLDDDSEYAIQFEEPSISKDDTQPHNAETTSNSTNKE